MSETPLHTRLIIPTNSTSVPYKEKKDNKGGKEDGTGVRKKPVQTSIDTCRAKIVR